MIAASYADITCVPIRLLLVALAVMTGACAAKNSGAPRPRPFPGAALPPAQTEPAAPAPDAPQAPEARQALQALQAPPVIYTALGFLGIPYRNGGTDPAGFDCSGFVQYVFAQHGLALPREVKDQYRFGHEIEMQDARPGDLIFFETVSRGASHVGMIVGDGRFVHAPSSRGVVRVEAYVANYWSNRIVGARRVVSETAPLTF